MSRKGHRPNARLDPRRSSIASPPYPGWNFAGAVYDLRRNRTLVLQNDILWALESGHATQRPLARPAVVERPMSTPGTEVFELRGPPANPWALETTMQFTLPDAAPATLELLDVAGRRLWRQDVGPLGGGTHVMRVPSAAAVAPGVYLLRLTRGTATLTSKVIRLRQ